MNDRNLEIPEVFQEKSPNDLITMCIDAMLKIIENANNLDINVLQGYLPNELFEKIEGVILLMFGYNYPAQANLRRIKKLLPAGMFELRVKAYLAAVISNPGLEVDIAQIRDTVPLDLYKIFLNEYLKSEDRWSHFLETELHVQKEDVLTLLDYQQLTLEIHLVFMNIPDRVADVLEHTEHCVVQRTWMTRSKPGSVYCGECIQNKKRIVEQIEASPMDGRELTQDYLANPKLWCCECLYTPLLKIIHWYCPFVRISEHIGNYKNPINL